MSQDPSTTKKTVAARVANLEGRDAFHIERAIVQCVLVRSVQLDDWGLMLVCQPCDIPGLPAKDSTELTLAGAWETLSTTAESFFSYFSSWTLMSSPWHVQQGKERAMQSPTPEEARAAVRSLTT
jgi:hypothetical protein